MLTVRPIREEDEDAVQLLASDPAIGATSLVPSPYPPGGAREFIERALCNRERGSEFVFALVAAEGLVGLCALHDVGAAPESCELGYWVGKPYWGRGYASAGAEHVVRWGFANLAATRLTAHCLARNRASARVLEKVGFRVIRREPNTHPKWLPTDTILRFELARMDWVRRRDPGARAGAGPRPHG